MTRALQIVHMPTRLTFKNIIMILVMIALVFIGDEWLKANLPALYPFRSIVYGIAVGIGGVFNALPGQREEEADNSVKANLLTFFGAVVFTFLFFGLADMIYEKYPGWWMPFRITLLGLLTAAWYRTAKRR